MFFPHFCVVLLILVTLFSRIQHTQLQEGGAGGHGPLGLRALRAVWCLVNRPWAKQVILSFQQKKIKNMMGTSWHFIYHHIPSWAFNQPEYENMDKTSRDSKKSMADLTKIGTGQFDVLFPPLFRKHLDSLDEMICFTARHATWSTLTTLTFAGFETWYTSCQETSHQTTKHITLTHL